MSIPTVDIQSQSRTESRIEMDVEETESVNGETRILCWNLIRGTHQSLGVGKNDEPLSFHQDDNATDGRGSLYSSLNERPSGITVTFVPDGLYLSFPRVSKGREKRVKGTLITKTTITHPVSEVPVSEQDPAAPGSVTTATTTSHTDVEADKVDQVN